MTQSRSIPAWMWPFSHRLSITSYQKSFHQIDKSAECVTPCKNIHLSTVCSSLKALRLWAWATAQSLVHILRRDKNQAAEEKKTDSLWQGSLGYKWLKYFSESPFWIWHTLNRKYSGKAFNSTSQAASRLYISNRRKKEWVNCLT